MSQRQRDALNRAAEFVSARVIASHRAWLIAESITTMARRLADAERQRTVHGVLYGIYQNEEDRIERDRWTRMALRRERGLKRLAELLRDLPAGERIDYQEEK